MRKPTRNDLSLISWCLLEYEICYASETTNIIHQDWISLRTISDSLYDSKVEVLAELQRSLGLEVINRFVGLDTSRASVQIAVEKLRKPFCHNNYPSLWPHSLTRSDSEILFQESHEATHKYLLANF